MNGQHPQDEDEFLAEAKRQSAAAGPPSAADPFLAEAQRQASQKPKPPRKSLQTRALGMGLGAAEAMGIRAGRTPLQTAGDIGGGFMQMAGTVPALLAPLPLKQRIAPLREVISGQAETFKRALADDPKAQGAALVALLGALSPIHSIAKYGRGAVAPPPSTPPSGPSGAPMAPGPRSLLPRAPLEEPHGLDIEAAPRQEYAARATPEAPVVPGEAGTRIRPVEPSPGASSVSPADQLVLKLREALGLGELEEPHARSFPEPPVAATPPRPPSSASLQASQEAPVVQNARAPKGPKPQTPEAIANAERLGREGGDNPYYPGNELWQAFERGRAQPVAAPEPLDPQERRIAQLPFEGPERRGGPLLPPEHVEGPGAPYDADFAEPHDQAALLGPKAPKTTQSPEQPAAGPPEAAGEPPLVESFPSPLLRSSAELRELAEAPQAPPPLEFDLQGGEGMHKVARVRDASGVEGDLILDRSSGDWTVYGTLKGTLSDAFKQRLQDRLGAEGVHTPLVYRTRGEQTLVNKAPRAKGRALPPSENLSIEGIAERERLQGELEQLQAQFDQIAHTPGNEQRAAQLGTKMDNIRRRQRKLTEGRGLGEAGFARIRGTPGAQLSPAEQAVHDRIGVGVKALATPKREWWHWFAQKTGETTHTAGVLERQAAKAGRQLPMPQRARLWMKAYLDSPKRMENAIYGTGPGHFDPQSGAWQQSDAPGLSTILEPIKGDATKVAQWRALLIAERAAAYERQGFATGIDPAAAADVVRTAPADVRAVAQGARYWMDAILDGAVQNGALPDWLAALWRDAYPEYVPYERVFDESGAPRKGGFGARSAGGIRPPSKRVKGSEELIGDPAETIPDYGRRWIRYTDLHRAAKSVVDLIDQNRDLFGDLAVKLDSKPLTPSTAQAAIGELLSEKSLKLEGGTLRLYNAASNAVETWKLEPIVADMFEGMTGQEWGMVTEILAATKGGLQFGVTNNPFFGLKNWMRDNFGRPTVSEATSVPFSGGALGELARRSPESKRFHAMGGGFGVIQESQGGMGALRRALPGRSGSRAIQAERQARAEKLVGKSRVLTRPLGALADLLKKSSVPFEESTRAAEFAKQKQLGRSDLESYVETQETMGNFAEHGSAPWMRWLNHVTPFLNPKVQGLRRAAQVGAKRPGITALKAVATLTVPTLALYMLNKDDKEIQQLRQGPGGYNYWYLRVSPNTVVKLPKPFLQGAVFATAFEHWLDSWRGEDPDGFARTARDMGNELWQTSVNPLFGTAYGIATNRDPYSNVPLVPADQANVLPEEQTGRHPSPTLTKLSHALPKAARFSPAQAQFALSQHGGTLGREGLRLADILSAADEQPAPGGADIPFANMFVARTPSTSTGPIRDVYGEAKRPLETLNTLRYLAGKGQAKELRRFVDEYQAEIGQGAAAEPAVKIMSQLAELIERVEKAPGMSPEVRAQTRDELIRRLNAVAEVLHSQAHTLAAPAPKR